MLKKEHFVEMGIKFRVTIFLQKKLYTTITLCWNKTRKPYSRTELQLIEVKGNINIIL